MRIKRVVIGAILLSTIVAIGNIFTANTAHATISNTSMSAQISPSYTIEISSNNVALNIAPSPNGTFDSDYTTVTTYTNTNDKCTVVMITNSTNLVSGNNTIPTLEESTSVANFANDHWGFRVGSTGKYNSVIQENIISTYNEATGNNGSDSNVYFGAKLTTNTKAGTYTGTVSFAATCAPSQTIGILDLEYMQDFATLTSNERTEVLASMTTSQQYQLMDNRDNKTYYISKLADGNVWMTQNLDHDIVAQANYYTPQNTDIPSAWTPARATYPTAVNGTSAWCVGGTWNSQYHYCESNYTPESYNPGNLYWNGTESNYNDWNTYNASCDFTTNTPVCNETLNPITTYTTNAGTPTTQYHIGNYYNWTAAVAMNDTSSLTELGELADQSICPAGWTLPRAGEGDDTFSVLWDEYGFNSSSINGTDKLWELPLYVVASGEWSGSLNSVGAEGNLWSPVTYVNSRSYNAFFSTYGSVSPSRDNIRVYGYPVRCILRPVTSRLSGLPLG